MKRHLWLLTSLSALLVVACGSDPSKPEVHTPKVTQGSTMAVVSFRDCTIADQDDCKGSGDKATDIFMSQFANSTVFHASKLPRPVDAQAEFSDDAAVAYAKSKGYAYVMNGEVTDYVPLHWFRKQRAGIAVRVLSVADGKTLYVHTDSKNGSFGDDTPESMFKGFADDVEDDLEDN